MQNHDQQGQGGAPAGRARQDDNSSTLTTEQRRAQLVAVTARAAELARAADEAAAAADAEGDAGGEICFICAEGPVEYWSVGACNHRTCHTCSIRLRALYKKNECTFCKVRAPVPGFAGRRGN